MMLLFATGLPQNQSKGILTLSSLQPVELGQAVVAQTVHATGAHVKIFVNLVRRNNTQKFIFILITLLLKTSYFL